MIPPHDPLPSDATEILSLRTSIEGIVSQHLGAKWRVDQARDMTEFSCHPSAILSGGSHAIFAKFSDAEDGQQQFEVELAGLRLLSERSGVLTPAPIGIFPVSGGCILILEAVQAVERTLRHWRGIGTSLARIHRVKGETFGLDRDGFFGPLHQDNTPMDDWPTFYAEHRLWPGLKLAVASGHMPTQLTGQVEELIRRVPDLCGPSVAPTLVHGDAQQNNFISSESGTFVIDPAVYYGIPEVDLAFIDYFLPVPDSVFDAYREEMPIDSGFWDRRDLWRVWGYLGAVAVEGPRYLVPLAEAVGRYV